MMHNRITTTVLIVLPLLFIVSGVSAAGGLRFPVGLVYIGGYKNLVDAYEDNLENEGYDVDVTMIPAGVSFHPYLQFDNGIRAGAGAGPILYIAGDANHFELPVNLNMGYTFLPNSNWSPYCRGGLIYHIASGDYVEGGDPGFFGAVGAEIKRFDRIGFGCEIGIDTSEIELEISDRRGRRTKKTATVDWMVSVFVIF